jgi:cob(I)alamin adenosyltransferase
MANRLSTIVTRTGDDGTTGLGDGTRVPKDSLRVCSMGEVDELNSFIGLWLAEPLPAQIAADLLAIQQDLFNLGAELCMPGYAFLTEAALARLDERIATYNATLPRLEEFILPGGGRASALAHVCRTVCRRVERTLVQLGHQETRGDTATPPLATRYCNRLSDLFFVMGRVVFRHDNPGAGPEAQWANPGSPNTPA